MTTLNISTELKTLVSNFTQLQKHYDFLTTMQYENKFTLQLDETCDTLESELNRIDLLNITALNFNTGTVWLKTIYVLNESESDDIMGLIDGYALNESDDTNMLTRYEYDEVSTYDDDYQDESFLAVNGGEYYTDMIESVKNISFCELYRMLYDANQLND